MMLQSASHNQQIAVLQYDIQIFPALFMMQPEQARIAEAQ